MDELRHAALMLNSAGAVLAGDCLNKLADYLNGDKDSVEDLEALNAQLNDEETIKQLTDAFVGSADIKFMVEAGLLEVSNLDKDEFAVSSILESFDSFIPQAVSSEEADSNGKPGHNADLSIGYRLTGSEASINLYLAGISPANGWASDTMSVFPVNSMAHFEDENGNVVSSEFDLYRKGISKDSPYVYDFSSWTGERKAGIYYLVMKTWKPNNITKLLPLNQAEHYEGIRSTPMSVYKGLFRKDKGITAICDVVNLKAPSNTHQFSDIFNGAAKTSWLTDATIGDINLTGSTTRPTRAFASAPLSKIGNVTFNNAFYHNVSDSENPGPIFKACGNLKEVGEIYFGKGNPDSTNAGTVSRNVFDAMFDGDEHLTTIGKLPELKYAKAIYKMFKGCRSLEEVIFRSLPDNRVPAKFMGPSHSTRGNDDAQYSVTELETAADYQDLILDLSACPLLNEATLKSMVACGSTSTRDSKCFIMFNEKVTNDLHKKIDRDELGNPIVDESGKYVLIDDEWEHPFAYYKEQLEANGHSILESVSSKLED